MEALLSIYLERLENIKQMFLGLLSSIQDSKLFVSKPQLTKYRVQYIANVIQKTLNSNQEKYIKRLENKIFQLQSQSNSQSLNASPVYQRKISIQKGFSSDYSSQEYFEQNQYNSQQFLKQEMRKYRPMLTKSTFSSVKSINNFNMTSKSCWKKGDSSGHSQSFNKKIKNQKSQQANEQTEFRFKYIKINI